LPYLRDNVKQLTHPSHEIIQNLLGTRGRLL
jgi:hypothetical protein